MTCSTNLSHLIDTTLNWTTLTLENLATIVVPWIEFNVTTFPQWIEQGLLHLLNVLVHHTGLAQCALDGLPLQGLLYV